MIPSSDEDGKDTFEETEIGYEDEDKLGVSALTVIMRRAQASDRATALWAEKNMKLMKKKLPAGPGKDVYNGSSYWTQWRRKRLKAEGLAEEARQCAKLDHFITTKKRASVMPVPCIDLTADNDIVDEPPAEPLVGYTGIRSDDIEHTICTGMDIESLIPFTVCSQFVICIDLTLTK